MALYPKSPLPTVRVGSAYNAGMQSAACVVDQDNLCHRGFDKNTGLPRPQARLDVLGFARALRYRGVAQGIVCRNWDFTALSDQLWQQLGFRVIPTRSNCDARVIISLILYVEAGFRDLVLVAGDGDYTYAVKVIRRCGARVEVWSRRSTIAKDLAAAADDVRFIDEFLTSPCTPPHTPRVTHMEPRHD